MYKRSANPKFKEVEHYGDFGAALAVSCSSHCNFKDFELLDIDHDRC